MLISQTTVMPLIQQLLGSMFGLCYNIGIEQQNFKLYPTQSVGCFGIRLALLRGMHVLGRRSSKFAVALVGRFHCVFGSAGGLCSGDHEL